MSIHNGWTKLYRVYKERAVFKDARMLQFFTWCLITAEYSPKEILVGYDAVVLQPGQLLLGKPGMRRAAEETGLSQQSMKTFVKKLSAGAKPLIRVETNPVFTIVTIVNPDTWESDQPAANPVLTQVQPAANPEPTRDQPADIEDAPCTPRAPAPARDVEEETKENHTQTISAAGDSAAQLKTAYRDALEAFREESGIAACDPNTKAGARIIAHAIVAGELDKSALRTVIKNGLADAKLPNQSFRGIANNFAKYLPKASSAQLTTARRILTYVCEDCGHVYRQYWTIDVEPIHPIRCTAGSDCKGRMLPHTAPIRASPSISSTVVA